MTKTSEQQFQAMCQDPAGAFDSPQQVLQHADLTTDQKAEILIRWEQDCRELEVAEEEGMAGGERARLDEVRAALEQVKPAADMTAGPSKHGGGVQGSG